MAGGYAGGLIPKGTVSSVDIKNPSALQAQLHRDEAANGSGSYYGKLDDGTEELIGGPGVSTLPVVVQVTAVDDITTQSEVDVSVGLILTPPAGNYLVWFSGSTIVPATENNSNIVYTSIYSGGAQIPSSEERSGGDPASPPTSNDINFPFNCIAIVSVDGTQDIEGRWRIEDGAEVATMHQRNLTALRIA